MNIRKVLAKNKFLKSKYHEIMDKKKEKKEKKERKRRITGKYVFVNRSKGKKKLCIILAGYKEFLWDEVFFRVKKYASDDIDICVLSSGLYSQKLNDICKKNEWSYLSTKRNHVGLVQNIAINLFKNAELIYKLDEDIFINKGFFEKLNETLIDAKKNLNIHVGMVTPLIPVNGYTYIKVLEELNLLNEYENKFGKTYYDTTRDNKVISNIDAVKYIWDKTSDLKKINENLLEKPLEYDVCPIRFSIGAILFERKLFEDMGYFKVSKTLGLGEDEEDICCYCLNESKAVVASKNTIVGHLSFAPTNKDVEKLYKENKILNRLSRSNDE